MEKKEKNFNPKVSVVIPVYNGSDFMREAIDSALNQTYRNIEVIVVNDGSSDNSEEIAKSYGNKIIYFYKENGGVASALNLGIKKMTGEYFSWLSCDDVYFPEKINEQINCIKYNRDVLVVYSNVEYIDENSNPISKTSHEKVHSIEKLNDGLYPVLKGLANGCSIMISKKCFDSIGMFDETLQTSNDYDMWFRLFRISKIQFIPKVLIKYRLHKNQGTKTSNVYIKESNELWIKIMESMTTDEMLKIEKSVYEFYTKFANQMKEASFLNAYRTATKLAKKNDPKKTPKVSVIMPCFNTEKYLSEAVESILNQTFTDFELIIVDDGSTDGSWEIINKYKKNDDRIIAIKNKTNEGISKSMNIGLNIARGEYVTRMDSDDISLPKRFNRQVIFLDKNHKYGLCSVNISSIDAKGKILSEALFIDTNIPLEWLFLWLNPISNAPTMYRSEIVKKFSISYNEKLKTAEDYDFLCKIIQHTRVAQIKEVLYIYRIHDESMFHKNIKETCENSIVISENLVKSLTGKNPPMFYSYLTVFSEFHKKELGLCSMGEVASLMNELLMSAKSKWNWSSVEFENASSDANTRLLNYDINIHGDPIKKSKDDLDLIELSKNNCKRAILEKACELPIVGKFIYRIYRIMKFLLSLLVDLKTEARLLILLLNCKKDILIAKLTKHEQRKKILFIAMLNSIHTARWISQLSVDQSQEIHIFPSTSGKVHYLIKSNKNIIVHDYIRSLDRRVNKSNRILKRVIKYLKPDIVHTLEMQNAAYQILSVKQKTKGHFPIWFYSCWGSDIKWFEQFPEHKEKIIQVLNGIDAFFCEDDDTIEKAKKDYHFTKEILKVHAPGGFQVEYYQKKFKPILPSKREYLIVKGYSGWVYRPRTIFEAIKLNAKKIIENKIKIMVFLPGDIQYYIDELRSLGIEVHVFGHTEDYDKVMELFSKARANIAASLSDGIPTSMVEGMLMGAFPIQSWSKTSTGATEYVIDGKNGFLLDPMDINGYAKAIERIITDGDLLDCAAIYSIKLIKDRADYDMVREKVLAFYRKFLQ